MMSQILEYYNKGLELIPVAYRIPFAIIILVVLVFSLISFLRKNLIWIVLFILLLPAAWPALKQIGGPLWALIQKIPK